MFYNSFLLTNYEWTMKSNLEEKSEEKEEEQKDERLKRKSKVIDSIVLAHENEMHSDFKTHEVFAKATVFARNLANIRGSHATPCFME